MDLERRVAYLENILTKLAAYLEPKLEVTLSNDNTIEVMIELAEREYSQEQTLMLLILSYILRYAPHPDTKIVELDTWSRNFVMEAVTDEN